MRSIPACVISQARCACCALPAGLAPAWRLRGASSMPATRPPVPPQLPPQASGGGLGALHAANALQCPPCRPAAPHCPACPPYTAVIPAPIVPTPVVPAPIVVDVTPTPADTTPADTTPADAPAPAPAGGLVILTGWVEDAKAAQCYQWNGEDLVVDESKTYGARRALGLCKAPGAGGGGALRRLHPWPQCCRPGHAHACAPILLPPGLPRPQAPPATPRWMPGSWIRMSKSSAATQTLRARPSPPTCWAGARARCWRGWRPRRAARAPASCCSIRLWSTSTPMATRMNPGPSSAQPLPWGAHMHGGACGMRHAAACGLAAQHQPPCMPAAAAVCQHQPLPRRAVTPHACPLHAPPAGTRRPGRSPPTGWAGRRVRRWWQLTKARARSGRRPSTPSSRRRSGAPSAVALLPARLLLSPALECSVCACPSPSLGCRAAQPHPLLHCPPPPAHACSPVPATTSRNRPAYAHASLVDCLPT